MSANREYKDRIFTALFSTPDKLLELYNAMRLLKRMLSKPEENL